jgi:hypothetical protein
MSDEVDAFTYAAMRGMTTKELQEVQAKRLAAETQRKINGGLMNTGIAGAMGNAAQGSILSANTTAVSNSPLVMKTSPGTDRTIRSKVELGLQIIQAENGFIVHVGNHYGGLTDVHIAATLEDVNTIITSQLASRMLDRTE